jgi:DNA-binding Xre family transcriptional regulator
MSDPEIVKFTRKIVIDYIHDSKISLNEFAKRVDVHQPNLHVFINGKGLSILSLEKIWKYLEVNIRLIDPKMIKK